MSPWKGSASREQYKAGTLRKSPLKGLGSPKRSGDTHAHSKAIEGAEVQFGLERILQEEMEGKSREWQRGLSVFFARCGLE